MNESNEVLTYHQDVPFISMTVHLGGVSQNSQDYAELNELYQNALVSVQWCHDTERWSNVLNFMDMLAEFLHLQGHWLEAAQYSELTLTAARQSEGSKIIARWLFYSGLIQDELGNYEDAEAFYQQCLELAQDAGHLSIKADAWRRLGWLAHVQGKRATAKTNYQRALKLHRQNDDHQGKARDLRQLGLLALKESDFDLADKMFHESLALVKSDTDKESRRLQAGNQLDLGRIALRQGHPDEAEEFLNDALEKFLDDTLPAVEKVQDRQLQSDIHFHRAIAAEMRAKQPSVTVEAKGKLYETAQKQYQKQRDQARVTGDKQRQTSALIALGTLHLQWTQNYDAAQNYYKEARKFGNLHNQAVATIQLGTLAYLQGNYEEAEQCLQQALKSFEALDLKQELAGCYQQLGLVAQTQHQWQTAEEHYRQSLQLRLKLGLNHDVIQSLYQLGTLAQQLGDLDVAQSYYQRALAFGEPINFSGLSMIYDRLKEVSSF